MSEPLTPEGFERFTAHFDDTITAFKAHVDERFDNIDKTLNDHTKRLEHIEELLWQGERLAELEQRVRSLAERSGFADLAVPLTRPHTVRS